MAKNSKADWNSINTDSCCSHHDIENGTDGVSLDLPMIAGMDSTEGADDRLVGSSR